MRSKATSVFHLAHLSPVSIQGQALPELETNANCDRAYKVCVHENSNEIGDSQMVLTFVSAPLDLAEADVPLGPHRRGRHQVSPVTVGHSLLRVV